jgi:pimeloyl-ACP methyl ester carboxylesterase
MAQIKANGIDIEYETFGNDSNQPILLIGGLGDQLIHWDEAFCRSLTDAGFFVIIFDNRDAGLSSPCDFPYSLDDMADDAVGLLKGLGIGRAHICGTSMGGMIAQTIAILHPSQVSSIILIYTTSGRRDLPPPDPKMMDLLMEQAPADHDGYMAYMVSLYRSLSGKGFPFDEQWIRLVTEEARVRSRDLHGTGRQIMAIQKQKDRRGDLARLSVPALIIHGTDDPLLSVEAAVDLADAIKGSTLKIIEGMGHDLPHGGSWVIVSRAIIDHLSAIQQIHPPNAQ